MIRSIALLAATASAIKLQPGQDFENKLVAEMVYSNQMSDGGLYITVYKVQKGWTMSEKKFFKNRADICAQNNNLFSPTLKI